MQLIEQISSPMVLVEQCPRIEKVLQNLGSNGAVFLSDVIHNSLQRLESVATRKNEVENIKVGLFDCPGSTFPAVEDFDAVPTTS